MLVLWQDATRGYATFMQRYNGAGQPLQTDDWYVGTGAVSGALDRAGNFVIARHAPDGSGNGVFATVYDRGGAIRVSEFRANATTAGEQAGPIVAMNAGGSFVITWRSNNQAVYARRYNANGTAATGELLVSSSTNMQAPMGVGVDRYGSFVVTWYSQVPQTNQIDVWARRYSSSGTPLTNPFLVNSYTAGTQIGNQIAMSPGGSFVVVWESYGQDGNSWGIFGQRYDANANRIGGEFRVNTLTTGAQQLADVAMMDDGSFVAVWNHDNRENDPASQPTVYARQFRADGSAYGPETVVNTLPNSKAFYPKIGLDLAGNYLVGWQHVDNATGDVNVMAQRYVMDTLPAITPLSNAQTVAGLSGLVGSWRYFKITVPPGMTTLDVSMFGSGDADLYVRYAALPTLMDWDARPYLWGSNERAVISSIPAGDWYIGIYGYSSYSSVSINATHY